MFLGINYNGMHDSSISVLTNNGNVALAISEERLSRVKKDGRFPNRALELVDLTQITHVGVPYLREPPVAVERDPFFDDLLPIRGRIMAYPNAWHQQIDDLNLPISYFDHHLSHAATGYFLSGFTRAIVLTADFGAANCAWSTAVYDASPEGIKPLHVASIHDYCPICTLYSHVTAILGFTPCKHEGKVTGLSARGKKNLRCEEALLRTFLNVAECELRGLVPNLYKWEYYLSSAKTPTLVVNHEMAGYLRVHLGQYSDEDIAYAAQEIITRQTCAVVSRIIADHPGVPLILSGGMFANVRLNLEVKRLGLSSLFVCPPMGDEGLSLGAAVLARVEQTGGAMTHNPVHNIFWGPELPLDANKELAALKVQNTLIPEPFRKIAELLAENKTVALVSGRAEFGPRALGHRSILCSATDKNVNSWLNNQLKRSEFMPFAPVIRAERAQDFFHMDDLAGAEHTLEYMTMCVMCREIFAQICPAVVHIDGTARPQIVREDSHPELYNVLLAYENITGLPAIINTSFNVHDEPIVNTISDAIKAFVQSQLDYLVVNNRLISQAQALEAYR